MPRPKDEPIRDENPGRPLPCSEDTLTADGLDAWVAPSAACPECCLPCEGYPHHTRCYDEEVSDAC